MIKSPRTRVLLICLLALAAVGILVWFLQKRSGHYTASELETPPHAPAATPSASAVAPTPLASVAAIPKASTTTGVSDTVITPSPSPLNSPSVDTSSRAPAYDGTLNLIIPVAGVKKEQLRDTFADSRSEGRVHDAIDIPAAAGTSVLAAADGGILKLFQSEKGGTTVYQLSADKKLVFYYAHLQGYAAGLVAGKAVRQGEVIAYVGDTGNAGTGNYHLHFSIATIADPKRYWEGKNINPYPLLRK
ncbi:MAG: M23 family metallopeptidase [Acidobacteriota bacterium]